MSYAGFQSDAAFFDLIAPSADPKDRQHLRQVAATYRTLAKNAGEDSTREEHWSNRAATCRELSEKFRNPACRTHLLRLAETYDLLAATCSKRPPRPKTVSSDHLAAPSRGAA